MLKALSACAADADLLIAGVNDLPIRILKHLVPVGDTLADVSEVDEIVGGLATG